MDMIHVMIYSDTVLMYHNTKFPTTPIPNIDMTQCLQSHVAGHENWPLQEGWSWGLIAFGILMLREILAEIYFIL